MTWEFGFTFSMTLRLALVWLKQVSNPYYFHAPKTLDHTINVDKIRYSKCQLKLFNSKYGAMAHIMLMNEHEFNFLPSSAMCLRMRYWCLKVSQEIV